MSRRHISKCTRNPRNSRDTYIARPRYLHFLSNWGWRVVLQPGHSLVSPLPKYRRRCHLDLSLRRWRRIFYLPRCLPLDNRLLYFLYIPWFWSFMDPHTHIHGWQYPEDVVEVDWSLEIPVWETGSWEVGVVLKVGCNGGFVFDFSVFWLLDRWTRDCLDW